MAPIHDAARDGDADLLRLLLADGASPDARRDYDAATPLIALCMLGGGYRVACLKALLAAGANLEARCHSCSKTALHYACQNANTAVVSLLLQAGVDVNVSDRSGYTPLHHVAMGLKAESGNCVDLLITAGASLEARTVHGRNPLDQSITIWPHRGLRIWPVLLRAGTPTTEIVLQRSDCDPYLKRVLDAGSFQKYAQNHLAAITKLFAANGRRLPPEVVRHIMKYWLHAGYY